MSMTVPPLLFIFFCLLLRPLSTLPFITLNPSTLPSPFHTLFRIPPIIIKTITPRAHVGNGSLRLFRPTLIGVSVAYFLALGRILHSPSPPSGPLTTSHMLHLPPHLTLQYGHCCTQRHCCTVTQEREKVAGCQVRGRTSSSLFASERASTTLDDSMLHGLSTLAPFSEISELHLPPPPPPTQSGPSSAYQMLAVCCVMQPTTTTACGGS
ncbi:hypothetical protein G7046_g9707 [Stylonectria norvegica]|nr:hypothetical protein G7046_g9707 [Stylonectria norvegica]